MKIVGLTGGIGSGKSTVLNLFKDLGAAVYVADIEAKKLMNNDVELIQQIKNLFGEQAYVSRVLDRKYISSIVFNDEKKLQALNKLVHPKVRSHFNNFIKKVKSSIVIYEAAILFESNNSNMCDFIITVIADFDAKIERVMKRDNASKEQILNRIKSQSSDTYKVKKSDFVISNNNLNYTKKQVETVFGILTKFD